MAVLKPIRCPAPNGVRLARDAHGVVHVDAESLLGANWALGYAHAMDRGLQLLLMRILGQGRASECLDSGDETLAIDTFFRRMNWSGSVTEQVDQLDATTRDRVQAYCDGINARLGQKVPWELRLVRYKPEPWRIEDCVLMTRMAGYLTLAQSQAETERLLLELLQAGLSDAHLAALFPQIPELAAGIDRDLLGGVALHERIIPAELAWLKAAPAMVASNNWVVSGTRTASGKPLLANDPHLEANRVPPVWYEIVARFGPKRGDYVITGTMPGIPAPLVGRNGHLAWGATYTFMDGVDSWVEDCKDGQHRRGDEWHDFRVRREMIKRKGKPDVELVFYENEHGVLDGNPNQPGHYLATRWAPAQSGARSLEAGGQLWQAASVEEGMACLGQIETAWNWVLADTEGHIGFQMSGLLPLRKPGASGFVPLPGWDPENDWRGFAAVEDLPRSLDPEPGYLVTANQDLNHLGNIPPINMPMGDYRARRIEAVLAENDKVGVEDTKRLHYDVHSIQAEAFLEVLGPLLPDNAAGRLLRDWDLAYDPYSRGATLFEAFYRSLVRELLGGGVGAEVAEFVVAETGFLADFYAQIDALLLAETSPWHAGRTREELFRKAFDTVAGEPVTTWGETNRFRLDHLMFGGRLPRFLGFDRGPVALRGGRATPHQGQIYRAGNRLTSFAPSLRLIADLATDELHSNLCGGPSDRRFSRWYCSDLKNWLDGTYKTLSA